jgi:hypothetical protein
LITPPTGVTINSSSGVISVDTDAIAADEGFYRTAITVRATNGGGSDDSVFNLTVCTVHYITLSGSGTTNFDVDASGYSSTNRRFWLLCYDGFSRTLTIDGVTATSLATQTQATGYISRVYTSATADSTINCLFSGALQNALTVAFVTYGYGSTLTDTAYASDTGNDADASPAADINVSAGGVVMGISRGWETITTPSSGMQLATANNFCVVGAIIVPAGDATYDLTFDTDTNTASKHLVAISVDPLAA